MNTALRKMSAPGRRGFTLVEAAVCTLLVGLILVAAISTVGAAGRSRRSAADGAMACLLAGELLAEITAKPYSDPEGSASLGLDGGENPSDRTSFDDVDDFAGYSDSPLKDANGAAIAGAGRFKRSVSVEYVAVLPPNLRWSSDTGAKRIIVTISTDAGMVYDRAAIRTRAADAGRVVNAAAGVDAK